LDPRRIKSPNRPRGGKREGERRRSANLEGSRKPSNLQYPVKRAGVEKKVVFSFDYK